MTADGARHTDHSVSSLQVDELRTSHGSLLVVAGADVGDWLWSGPFRMVI